MIRLDVPEAINDKEIYLIVDRNRLTKIRSWRRIYNRSCRCSSNCFLKGKAFTLTRIGKHPYQNILFQIILNWMVLLEPNVHLFTNNPYGASPIVCEGYGTLVWIDAELVYPQINFICFENAIFSMAWWKYELVPWWVSVQSLQIWFSPIHNLINLLKNKRSSWQKWLFSFKWF
jgi:excinuclease ABC subunit A